jgi:hypothetical protein
VSELEKFLGIPEEKAKTKEKKKEELRKVELP